MSVSKRWQIVHFGWTTTNIFLFLYANKQTNKAAWNCYSSYYTSLQLDYTSNYSEVQIRFKLGSKCLKSAWKTLIIWICSYLSHKVVYPNRRLSCLPQSFVLEQKGAACAKEHLLLLHVVEYPCRLFKYRLRERERERKRILILILVTEVLKHF